MANEKILMHHNGGDPIYIAMCDAFNFYVIYRDLPVSSHLLHMDAIASAKIEFLNGAADEITGNAMGWKPTPQFSLA